MHIMSEVFVEAKMKLDEAVTEPSRVLEDLMNCASPIVDGQGSKLSPHDVTMTAEGGGRPIAAMNQQAP